MTVVDPSLGPPGFDPHRMPHDRVYPQKNLGSPKGAEVSILLKNALPNQSTENGFLDAEVRSAIDSAPWAADIVVTELIGMRGPYRCRSERSGLGGTGIGCAAAELMIDRIHQILGNAPRQRLSHRRAGRHHQCGRLAVLLGVVSTVPWTLDRCGGPFGPQRRQRIARVGDRWQGEIYRNKDGGEGQSSHDV